MAETVLVIGGYGVFGGRLARRLIADGRFDVVVAGRSLDRARQFCAEHGGRAAVIDIAADPAAALAVHAPFIVVDAAGPFQSYAGRGYPVAEAAIACGAHYIDLSDDGAFAAGISALDAAARSRRVSVIAGASSVPGISSAAADVLCEGLDTVDLIESVILPGNRAPRGRSVVAAILAQVGRPVAVFRNGAAAFVTGWGEGRREKLDIPGVRPVRRTAYPIGAPDALLFPPRYRAANVRFRAGLELTVMNLFLLSGARMVRCFPALRLERLTPLLLPIADRLAWAGSDRGGMQVRVRGTDADGVALQRHWTLIAEHGDGPEIPAFPAYLLCTALLGHRIAAGARACLGDIPLADIEALCAKTRIRTHRRSEIDRPVFAVALGPAFDSLPAPIRHLHDARSVKLYRGAADIRRGGHPFARLAGWLFGFPGAGRNVPARVTITRDGDTETWQRDFGSRFVSQLSRRKDAPPGMVTERFGPLAFDIGLEVRDGRLHYPVRHARLFGLPLPAWLHPVSDSVEHVDAAGRFRFSVTITLPLAGHMITYDGWLEPAEA